MSDREKLARVAAELRDYLAQPDEYCPTALAEVLLEMIDGPDFIVDDGPPTLNEQETT